jgi:hypothetical protein
MASPWMPAAVTWLLVLGGRDLRDRDRAPWGRDAHADRSSAKARQETAAGSPWANPFERP